MEKKSKSRDITGKEFCEVVIMFGKCCWEECDHTLSLEFIIKLNDQSLGFQV